MPRASVPGQSAPAGAASIAGLDGRSARGIDGPPLSASGASRGSATVPGHDAPGNVKLLPPSVMLEPELQFEPSLPATTLFASVINEDPDMPPAPPAGPPDP